MPDHEHIGNVRVSQEILRRFKAGGLDAREIPPVMLELASTSHDFWPVWPEHSHTHARARMHAATQ